MAPSTSLSVLPTTHSNPHRFDYSVPKPSSLFGPFTSSKLVTSFNILDSPDKGTIRYSIEALRAINQDSVTMTDRTRVLASQKAEHRKNLANYAKLRAAGKAQSQKKEEEVHAAKTRASTPPIKQSATPSKPQKPVYNKYSSLKASKRPRQVKESPAPKAVRESERRQIRPPQPTRPVYNTCPGLKASKRLLPRDDPLEPREIRETKRRKTDPGANARERKGVVSPRGKISAPNPSLKSQAAQDVIKASENGPTSFGVQTLSVQPDSVATADTGNPSSLGQPPLNRGEKKVPVSGPRPASPKSNNRKRPAEEADEGDNAASPKRVRVEHELSSEAAMSQAPPDVPTAKGETETTSPQSKQQEGTTSGSGDATESRQSSRPAGLSNFRFACYSNSVLQTLMCIPEIANIIGAVEGGRVQAADDYFAEKAALMEEDTIHATRSRKALRAILHAEQDNIKLTAYLGEVLSGMREAEKAGETTSGLLFNQACGTLLKDRSVLDGLQDGTPFNGEQPMDAAGFIDELLQQVKKELELERIDGNTIDDLIGTEGQQRLRCTGCGHVNSRPTDEWINMLKVEVNADNGGVGDLLANYFKPKAVQDYRCDGCHKTGAAIKSLHLTKTSPYLLVHLNRTRPDGKVRTDVPFPVAPISIDVDGTQRSYTAVNVVEHRSMGEGKSSMENGHYPCCRLVDDQWWSCSDDLVKKLTVSQAAQRHKQACFVLLKENVQL